MTFVWRTGPAMGRQLSDVTAVLFARDVTLAREPRRHDEPAAGRVAVAPRAAVAIAELRAAGLPVGVISASRGLAGEPLSGAELAFFDAQVDQLLGPFDTWQGCPHAASQWCTCRSPEPGRVLRAAEDLGVPSHQVAVIGDIGPDMRAAQAAGAVGILVPTARTLRAEIEESPLVAPDLISAVRAVTGVDRSWVPQQ
jgi:D-glycero-D-manno-heptose 1,7-bisphosphate phosphatase